MQVVRQAEFVREKTRLFIMVGRAGVLSGSSDTSSTVMFLASDVAVSTRLAVKGAWKTAFKAFSSLVLNTVRLFQGKL